VAQAPGALRIATLIIVAASDPEFGAWLKRGSVHIFSGYDHLAFLLALLLLGGTWRQVLLLITSFTVAHSLTLGAGAFGWIVLSPRGERWAEAAVAATIVLMALENLLRLKQPFRIATTFLFGLVHGLGFSNALRSYGLGPSPLGSLIGFALGVELGQAFLVALVFPILRALRGNPRIYRWVLNGGSAGILLAGSCWFVARIAA
jgi:hypothetical protein